MRIEIMDEKEFQGYLEDIRKELAYMKPGDTKRIALIGTVQGGRTGSSELAFTASQLKAIFDLGFPEKN